MAGIKDVAQRVGVKPDVISDVFEAIFTMIKKGDRVRIIGFGSFERKTFPGRKLQTPLVNDGSAFCFPDSYRVAFKQSQQAKGRLNRKRKPKPELKKVTKKKLIKKKKKKARK